jgi:hypothetical protein
MNSRPTNTGKVTSEDIATSEVFRRRTPRGGFQNITSFELAFVTQCNEGVSRTVLSDDPNELATIFNLEASIELGNTLVSIFFPGAAGGKVGRIELHEVGLNRFKVFRKGFFHHYLLINYIHILSQLAVLSTSFLHGSLAVLAYPNIGVQLGLESGD